MPIILGDSPRALMVRMVSDLARLRDPWARHWLVMRSPRAAEWVERRWAEQAGIASRSQVVTLRSVIEQAAMPGRTPFSFERLVLSVARVLAENRVSLPGARKSEGGRIDARLLAWAEQLAHAIDQTLLSRDRKNPFAEARFLQQIVEEPEVEEALLGHVARLLPTRFLEAARSWLALWERRGGVPRLYVMLDGSLPEVLSLALFELVELLGERARLYVLFQAACLEGTSRRPSAEEGSVLGPVLSCLGQRLEELTVQTTERWLSRGAGEEAQVSAPAADSLLGQLQRSCREPSTSAEPHLLAPGDWSFSVHSCRSAFRELEVCRDRLIQSMREDPSLRPEEILVLLVDHEGMAPLVGAAFEPLVVRGALTGRGTASKVVSALLSLLDALEGRLGVRELRGLLEQPLIAERFGLAEHVPEVVSWLTEARFLWGLDGAHRAAYQHVEDGRWDLGFALRRLGLGAVVEQRLRDGLVEGAAPLTRATGLSLAPLAGLARLAAELSEAKAAWVTPKGVPREKLLTEWVELLTGWCERFLAEGDELAKEHRTELLSRILPAMVRAAPLETRLASDAFRKLLCRALGALTVPSQANAAGILVAPLEELSGTPARVVAVVGLGREQFPRRDERPVWHPLGATRRPGDPDQRAEDRHALLLALLSASERVVLTYQGGADDDTKLRPLSPPVADLLSAIDVLVKTASGTPASRAVFVEHGLNGFSPRHCEAGRPAFACAQLPRDFAAARLCALARSHEYEGLWKSAPLPPVEGACILRARELRDLFEEPCRLFARRLGLSWPVEEEELSDDDLFEPSGLDAYGLRERLLRARLAAEAPERERPRLLAEGALPRGGYGQVAFDKALGDVPAIMTSELLPLETELVLELGGGVVLELGVPEGWYRDPDGQVLYVTASSLASASHLRRARIVALVLAATRELSEVHLYGQRDRKPRRLRLVSGERARELLQKLVDFLSLARCLPLPFWPAAHEKLSARLCEALSPSELCALQAAAYQAFRSRRFGREHEPSDAERPATRLCFRGLSDPFTWYPELDIPWLPSPELPLALRLSRFVADWDAGSCEAP